MELIGVRLDVAGNIPVLFLREREGLRRLLPIYIGTPEASSIQWASEGKESPRPLTHDLVVNLLGALGAILERVVITEVNEGTFLQNFICNHVLDRSLSPADPQMPSPSLFAQVAPSIANQRYLMWLERSSLLTNPLKKAQTPMTLRPACKAI